MNRWDVTGHLGRDAEVKTIESGHIVTFSIAVKSGFGAREKTIWPRITAFGKLAERLEKLAGMGALNKGAHLWVSGEIIEETYTSKEGIETTKWVVTAREVELLTPRQPEQGQLLPNDKRGVASPSIKQTKPAKPAAGNDFDDDIPF